MKTYVFSSWMGITMDIRDEGHGAIKALHLITPYKSLNESLVHLASGASDTIKLWGFADCGSIYLQTACLHGLVRHDMMLHYMIWRFPVFHHDDLEESNGWDGMALCCGMDGAAFSDSSAFSVFSLSTDKWFFTLRFTSLIFMRCVTVYDIGFRDLRL